MAYLNNNKYAIAVSGGSDSIALLHLCAKYCNKNCVVVHFDHNVRAESAEEAKFVEEIALKYGFSFEKKIWSDEDKSLENGNFYQSARLARYKFFKDVCSKYDLEGVLIAHSKTDLAETLLMRLGKGASIKGASIFKQGVDIYGVNVYRPLLSFNRKDLQNYLKTENYDWKTDPSNTDDKKLRPRVRKILDKLEEIGISLDGLKSSVEYFNQANDALDYYLQKEICNFKYDNNLKYYSIDYANFKNLPLEMQVRFVNYFIEKFSSYKIHLPRRKKIIKLLARLENTTIENIDILTLEIKNDIIYIYLSEKNFKFSKNSTYLKDISKDDRYNFVKQNKLNYLPKKIRDRLTPTA